MNPSNIKSQNTQKPNHDIRQSIDQTYSKVREDLKMWTYVQQQIKLQPLTSPVVAAMTPYTLSRISSSNWHHNYALLY